MINQILTYLVFLIIILVGGIYLVLVSKKTKINVGLLLILFGLFLSLLTYEGTPIIKFPSELVLSFSIIALALFAFDHSSELKFHNFDSNYKKSYIFTISGILISTLVLSYLLNYLIPKISLLSSLIFSLIVNIIFFPKVLGISNIKKKQVHDILHYESIFNMILILIFVFVSLEFYSYSNLFDFSSNFFQKILVGIGSGFITSLLLYKLIYYNKKSDVIVNLGIIATAITSYMISEILSGSGIIAVVTSGIIFGNLHFGKIEDKLSFSRTLKTFLGIFVFTFAGMLLRFFEIKLYFYALLLFLSYLVLRFIVISIFYSGKFNYEERIFMTLSSSKGIIALLLIMLLVYDKNLTYAMFIAILFVLYSYICSSFAFHYLEHPKEEEIEITSLSPKKKVRQN